MAETWTVLKVLEWTTSRFQRAGLAAARLEAQILLAHTLQCNRVSLYTNYDQPLAADELARYRALIQRRLAGEPVAYLVGEQEFWSLLFYVDDAVLIPRHDTETVIEVILDLLPDRQAALAIADIATGSGAIAVTLAKELPKAQVVATDLSPRALAMAARNAERNGVAARVHARQGDLLACLAAGERFDVLVSNPPYVRSGDIEALSAEVRHEPHQALDGGPDGLSVLARLIAAAPGHVAPGGWLVLEHGFDQAEDVARLIADTGAFGATELRRDLGGNARVTWARRLG